MTIPEITAAIRVEADRLSSYDTARALTALLLAARLACRDAGVDLAEGLARAEEECAAVGRWVS